MEVGSGEEATRWAQHPLMKIRGTGALVLVVPYQLVVLEKDKVGFTSPLGRLVCTLALASAVANANKNLATALFQLRIEHWPAKVPMQPMALDDSLGKLLVALELRGVVLFGACCSNSLGVSWYV